MKSYLNFRSFSRGRIIRLSIMLVFMGLLVLFAAATAKLLHQRSNPNLVFMNMLENNFRTVSVTRSSDQATGDQNVSQKTQLITGDLPTAKGRTVLLSTGEVTARVVTENLGTPYADYVRYTDIDTNQTNAQGQQVDYSAVVGTWGVSEQEGQPGVTGELYNEMTLGLIPFANLDYESRAKVMDTIREHGVYNIVGDTQKVERQGRPAYQYRVSVEPAAYIELLITLGQEMGLAQLADLDSEAYREAQPLEFTLTADIVSQRLVTIAYEDGRVERYGSYGVKSHIVPPEDTIPIQELQMRIQSTMQ
ncbi:hypothetical protein BH23PAT1_BH23PAT1_4330 [soil metagenome]